MAFRTDNVKASKVPYLFVVLKPLLLFYLKRCLVLLLGSLRTCAFPCPHLRVSAKLNIRTAACHVCCNSYSALGTGFSNNDGFACMVLCVQNLVPYSLACKKGTQMLRLFNRNRTNKNRLPLLVGLVNFLYDGVPFVAFVKVYLVILVLACYRLVGRNCNNVKVVNLCKFNSFGCGSTGHTGKLLVHAEVVLEGNRCKCAVPLGNLKMLLSLNRLVQTVTVAPSLKNAACKFIYNLNLVVLYNIVNVCVVEDVGPYSLGKVVHVLKVLLVKNSGAAFDKAVGEQNVVDLVHTLVGKRNALGLLVYLVVALKSGSVFRQHFNFIRVVAGLWVLFHLGKLVNVLVHLKVFESIVFTLAGYDERCTGLINKDRVYFVNDTEVKAPLNLALYVYLHVVAKVVKAKLIVCTVGKVTFVCCTAGLVVHIVKDAAYALPKELVYASHPVAVALGKVVVYGYDVNALSAKGVKVCGGNAHECLTFTGLHFRNAA